MRTKVWTETLGASEAEVRYELKTENGKPVAAKVIGYFTDDSGVRHEFVRWDSSHGRFHKHCLYERKQRTENSELGIQTAVNEAIRDLKENWRIYKSDYIKYHTRG